MLTKADKAWLEAMVARVVRRVTRQEVRAVIEEIALTEQMGGYDGATEVREDDYEQGKKRRVGF